MVTMSSVVRDYFQHGDSEFVNEHDDDDEVLNLSKLVLRESNKANGCKTQANKQNTRKMFAHSKPKDLNKVIFSEGVREACCNFLRLISP